MEYKNFEKLQNEEEREDIEIAKIRKSGKKVKISREEFFDKFDPSFCRYCMNYNDEEDSCNAGVSFEYWEEMDREGMECEKYDYIYEEDDE